MKRLPLIDLVRTFSILSVLAVHMDAFLRRPSNPALAWLWDHFQRNGTYGVYAFFLVSGFLITEVIRTNPGGLWKPSLKQFYVQRAGRILPLLVLTVWIGVLMLWTPRPPHASYIDVFHPEAGALSPGFWLSLAFFTFNWFLAFHPLASFGIFWNLLWSLSVEEQFYCIFPPALKILGNEKTLFKFLVSILVFCFGWRWLCYEAQWNNRDLQTFTSFGAFDNVAFGVLLNLAFHRWNSVLVKNKQRAFLCAALGFLLAVAVYLGTSMNNPLARVYASLLFASGLFLFLLGALSFPVWKSRGWEPFTWPGRYCYGGYLLHPILLAVFFPILFQMESWAGFALLTLVTTSVAAVSFHFFEKPANQLIRKTFHGPPLP